MTSDTLEEFVSSSLSLVRAMNRELSAAGIYGERDPDGCYQKYSKIQIIRMDEPEATNVIPTDAREPVSANASPLTLIPKSILRIDPPDDDFIFKVPIKRSVSVCQSERGTAFRVPSVRRPFEDFPKDILRISEDWVTGNKREVCRSEMGRGVRTGDGTARGRGWRGRDGMESAGPIFSSNAAVFTPRSGQASSVKTAAGELRDVAPARVVGPQTTVVPAPSFVISISKSNAGETPGCDKTPRTGVVSPGLMVFNAAGIPADLARISGDTTGPSVAISKPNDRCAEAPGLITRIDKNPEPAREVTPKNDAAIPIDSNPEPAREVTPKSDASIPNDKIPVATPVASRPVSRSNIFLAGISPRTVDRQFRIATPKQSPIPVKSPGRPPVRRQNPSVRYHSDAEVSPRVRREINQRARNLGIRDGGLVNGVENRRERNTYHVKAIVEKGLLSDDWS